MFRTLYVAISAIAIAACTPTRSTLKPPYLLSGIERSEFELQEIASARCIASTQSSALPRHKFTTDGCTLWPNGEWTECCITHDMAYWCGGPNSLRRRADEELRSCVAQHSSHINASMMYYGVRLFAAKWMPFPWRWGFGYSWPYKASETQGQPAETPPDGNTASDPTVSVHPVVESSP